MLQTKINNCNSLIDEVQNNKDLKAGNEKVAQRNNRFFDAFNKYLLPIMASLKATKSLTELSFSEELSNNLNKYIEITEVALNDKKVVNPDNYYLNLSKLYSDFKAYWENKTQTYNEPLLSEIAILRLVQSDSMEILQITKCITNIQNWPIQENAIKPYLIARARGEELLSEMEFDDDIKAFLQKVKSRQATLADLNEKILNWIKAEKFESKFFLTIPIR